ncbi:MAG: hypothetical protein V1755_03430 [Chloroflexota bacterium]
MTRRLLIYLALMAGIAAFSGLFIFIFGNSLEISCARDAGKAPSCRITRMLLGRVPFSSRDVLGVTDVELDESCDDGCAYRARLITAACEAVPLNNVYTDRGPVLRQIDALSGFLNGADKSLEYVEPVQWWVVALVVGLDLMGMAIVAGSFLREPSGG